MTLDGLPPSARLLVDSAPIIYVLEAHAEFANRFMPVFEAHAAGRVQLALSTVTLAEVLAGPIGAGDEALAERYRRTLMSWQLVDVDADIAERAARIRAAHRFRLPDAIQVATALAIGADALVTHDRDFSATSGLRILDGART